MDRARFLSELERHRKFCEGKSALYEALCAALARDLKAGKSAWPARLFEAWKGRTFTTEYEAPAVLLASLHYSCLKGDLSLESAIAPTQFPMARGTVPLPRHGANVPDVVLRYLAAAPDAFWDGVGGAALQTNEAGRAPGWMLPAAAAFLGQRLPFHLVDMGTSAGLTLIGDYLERGWVLRNEQGEEVKAPDRFNDLPYPVLSRTGLDCRPRFLADPEDRLWLKACIWPDDAARHERFDRACDLFVTLAKEKGGPRLHACGFMEMGAWVAEHLRPHPEEGLLLFNSQAADFLPDTDYAAFRAGVTKALEPWGERGIWIEFELPRGPGLERIRSDVFHELRAHRVRAGKLETMMLGTLTAHPRELRLREGWDFLVPGQPVRPRFTIEEPVKEMKPGVYKF